MIISFPSQLKGRSGTEGRTGALGSDLFCSPILVPPQSSSVALGKSFITSLNLSFFICEK